MNTWRGKLVSVGLFVVSLVLWMIAIYLMFQE